MEASRRRAGAREHYGASTVPEPSSLLLALLGLMLLTGLRGQQAINEHLARLEGGVGVKILGA